jgi:tetratricopeptide (TPR) repeat protein
MEDVRRQVLIFSAHIEASGADVANFPERVGAQVAAQLSWTAPLLAIDQRHPSDPAITSALLKQVSLFSDQGVLEQFERARRLAGKAPDSANAQLTLAFNTGFALGQIPGQDRRDAVIVARGARKRAQELAPEFGDVYIPWCLLHSEQRRLQCEDQLRAALKADPDAPFVRGFLSSLLMDVGRVAEAAELANANLVQDQYVPAKIGLSLRALEATGNIEDAARLYARANRWWPANGLILFGIHAGIVQRGDVSAAQAFQAGVAAAPLPASEDLRSLASADRTNSLSSARKACSEPEPDGLKQLLCMLTLARLGDLDFAFRLVDKIYPSRRGKTSADEERIWLGEPDPWPTAFITSAAAAPLRRDPRYLALAQRVGLLEYWRSRRLPDFCRQARPEKICAQFVSR